MEPITEYIKTHSSGPHNPIRIAEVKRDIARVKTILREQQSR